MPGTTPSVRHVADVRDVPARCEAAAQQQVPAPEVTVARLLACQASVAAVSRPPE
ncbi:hypothetical protein [Streptacidiphilus jiangxiensis]|uniref:Uncharacterized protein n=1 Tax=Streptacidiphilus jiangxiensis TaxID=235985 RepID=A0A1H7M842_STRJI|nr:hypothetical protein [Streptacidiphilus jiangxiensis]SEL07292.1 hypothetical protein SAMN05414137_105231 [Streptacidiphilus jiangxiensis]